MESSFPQKRESSCKPCIDRRSALTGTRPEDYGLSPGERLNEVITHSWSRLRRHYGEFAAAAHLFEGEAGTGLTNDKWSLPLLRVLGFGFLPVSAGPEIAGRSYAIGRFFGPVPVHLVGRGLSLDRRAAGQRGAAVVNPHGLVQEFLNRSDVHLWAIVSNGLRLRQLAGRIRGSRHGDLSDRGAPVPAAGRCAFGRARVRERAPEPGAARARAASSGARGPRPS